MSFEKFIVQPPEHKPEQFEKSGNLAHKIFETGAEGGKKLKTALRVLALTVALSPVLGDTAQAGLFGWGKKKEKTPVAKEEKQPAKRYEDLTPEEREFFIEQGVIIPPEQRSEQHEAVAPEQRKTTGPSAEKEKKPEQEWKTYVYGRGEMNREEYQRYQAQQDLIKLEKERMAYQYEMWRQLFNSPHFRYEQYVIIPHIQLGSQDRQFILHMYQTKTITAPKLFGVIHKYNSDFANHWMLIGNMLNQGTDYFGNTLSSKQLKAARINYINSLYYIAGEICR